MGVLRKRLEGEREGGVMRQGWQGPSQATCDAWREEQVSAVS